MHIDPLTFARAARVVGTAARALGVEAPSFRSPPRLPGVHRTLRRRGDGSFTVAIAVRGRPWLAILSDMVDGVLAANGLSGASADRCRTGLWRALEEADQGDSYRGPHARVAESVDAGGLNPPALKSA